jgi:hypothetical protein
MIGGVASADHRHGGRWNRGGGNWGGNWSGGVSVRPAPVRVVQPRVVVQSRPVYVQRTRVVRRPIYVQRPTIQYRYYDYYSRPAVIAENYPAMDGYYWVAGQWTWSGYEWSWQPGHYEPYAQQQYDTGYYDQSYNQGYDQSYNQGYYDSSYSSEPCDHPTAGVSVQAGVSYGY